MHGRRQIYTEEDKDTQTKTYTEVKTKIHRWRQRYIDKDRYASGDKDIHMEAKIPRRRRVQDCKDTRTETKIQGVRKRYTD